ncbi:MAG TPA: protein kinase, partial [Kofleriaceae bacterium]|nr:protein kinase [Kofleriaceae bacterium]
ETDDGEVPKLLDFGIARVRSPDSSLTRTGSVMGTASYMAPEQVAGNLGEIGSWTDIYAMGAILYEMLGGTPAYGGTTVTEVLQQVLRSEHTPLRKLRSDLPEAAYALVDRCMSQQPAQRPQDAEAMRIAVTAARLVPLGAAIAPRATAQTSLAPALTEGATPSVDRPVAEAAPPTSGEATPPPSGPEATRPPASSPSSVPAEPLEYRPRGPRIAVVGGAVAVTLAIVIGVIATRHGGHAAADAAVAVTTTDAIAVAADARTVAAAVDAETVAMVADAETVATASDAAIPVVDAHVADAHLATVADARPAPSDARVDTDCSHAEELVSKARQLAGEDNWTQALPIAEAAAACRPNNPNMHRIITIAACMAGNKTLAQAHWTQLVGKARNLARETCKQQGITLD